MESDKAILKSYMVLCECGCLQLDQSAGILPIFYEQQNAINFVNMISSIGTAKNHAPMIHEVSMLVPKNISLTHK